MDIEEIRATTNRTIVELLSTPYSNTTFIEQREATMQTVVDTALEAHPAPLIALTLTKIMLGKAEEAVSIANLAWEMGIEIPKILENIYIYELNALGLFSKSLVLLKPLITQSKNSREEISEFKNYILQCAIGLGDMDILSNISELEEFEQERTTIQTFIEQMSKKMLRQHFQAHQDLINKATFGKQVGYEVSFDTKDGYPSLELGIFMGGDSVDRYQMQQKLDKEYADYYSKSMISPLDNFSFSVFDIRQHWILEP